MTQTSREACIKALERAADELGHPPSAQEYHELGYTPSERTIKDVFGSWNAAKKAAGQTPYLDERDRDYE